ncbi:MAG TPA: succinate dehydrogenase cytochrome b558 subunit [Phycisphaerae bacterium]|nr:succinate dehydrogenase cytochrome b558 subunit [Phycisphaerae bacterium]HRW55096.1 succinate dehydrogenase cytochrome b558 subunit [Phycisphaerae bacterium]
MAESASAPQSFEARNHFLLRRLHSLTGIVPIGVFLIEHLLTNSMAAYGNWTGAGGREAFNHDVHFLHNLPYLPLLEIFGIFLPLAFHALYGVKIAMSAKHNVLQYPYMENRRYTMQRVTGYIAFVFIIVHLCKYRFAHVFGGIPFLDHDIADKFEITRRGLMNWVLPPSITITMYVIGLAASVYHFSNGIFTFCITWGITVGEKAQKRVSMLAAGLGVVLFAWGAVSLYAFANAEGQFLKNWDDRPGVAATAEDGGQSAGGEESPAHAEH